MKNVLVNGTFDILHPGHIQLLEYAKTLGNVTVAIDTDDRVSKLKGPTRPINTQQDRIVMLTALRCVDSVVTFSSDDELIQLVAKCDIMVKGSDYKFANIVGKDVCKEIVFFDILDGYSTTKKIQHIIDRR